MNAHAREPGRHHRQALLREVGAEGQGRLALGHALIVGCGALGTVSAEWLCRAGVGRLTLVDRDIVEGTNLQRQVLFSQRDAREGVPKAEGARRRLAEIDPAVRVEALMTDLTPANAQRTAPDAGVILDCTDNFETRYLLNDLAVQRGVALVYAGVVAMRGMQLTVLPSGATPCLRCLFPDPPAPGSAAAGATCDTVGVLGPAVGAIASVQAGEAIKVLLGATASVARGVLEVELWSGVFRRLDAGPPDPRCPCCAERRFEFLAGERAPAPGVLCGRGAVQVGGLGADAQPIDLPALARRLAPHGEFAASRFLVRGALAHEPGDAGSPVTLTVFADGRAIVGGTERPERARAIYARYVGG